MVRSEQSFGLDWVKRVTLAYSLELNTLRLWAELGSTWPNERGFWDDWLRETPQR